MTAEDAKQQSVTKKRMFSERLLLWFSVNKADFPWRKTTDPYKVLVSELLLRKTTRQQVSKIYKLFFSKYPDIKSLSKAKVESIERTIFPLGMEHIRAIALKEIAENISQKYGGKIPNRKKSLIELPHVGPYIANAVLCFAFGLDAPIVDTNVIRVISRVFSVTSSRKRPRDDPKMWRTVFDLIPKGKSRDFNLALLDFAASICVLRNPKCLICPMSDICGYYNALVSN